MKFEFLPLRRILRPAMNSQPDLTRRNFLKSTLCASALAIAARAAEEPEPIIDIHQHTNYSGRTNNQLVAHQKAMGATTTILLPAGRMYGLDAQCGGNETVVALAREFPDRFVYFANEIPYLAEAKAEITKYLKMDAIGIGEQKFRITTDSRHINMIAGLAEEFGVPALMHFQHAEYNIGIERFHLILEKYPKVNFIGHAQTWWGNIDKHHTQETMYPTGKVTRGGITDHLLTDYPNMFGDLSAGSGLNALIRDEDHTRGFLDRHQDKLLFGSDCNDLIGRGPGCQGAQILAAVRRLSPTKQIERKLLYGNAAKLFKLEKV
jgi:predicted TIM-barrel fold metal-dependent hydrolase